MELVCEICMPGRSKQIQLCYHIISYHIISYHINTQNKTTNKLENRPQRRPCNKYWHRQGIYTHRSKNV